MTEDEHIFDYYSRLVLIVNKMRRNGEKMEDVHFMKKLLHSLSSKFEHVVAAIEESKNLEEIIIEELFRSLQVHEQHIQKKVIFIPLEHALESKLTINDQGSYSIGCSHGRGRRRSSQ